MAAKEGFMPELPDLEVLKGVLSSRIAGREIVGARAVRPGILKTVSPPLDAIVGGAFTGIDRRGKHLILNLRSDLHLVVHLMLAGRFILARSSTPLTKATGLVISFADGGDLRLIENGPTKLVRVHLVADPEEVPEIASAGVEPLSSRFTVERLAGMARGKRREVKELITDQRVIAGIGSAYADEILFAARISPIRYVNTLSPEEIARLHAAIVEVLRAAIVEIEGRVGGEPFTDEVRDFLKVYKKAGRPCPVCGGRIAEIRYAKKRTYYCPNCQTKGRSLPDRRSRLNR